MQSSNPTARFISNENPTARFISFEINLQGKAMPIQDLYMHCSTIYNKQLTQHDS